MWRKSTKPQHNPPSIPYFTNLSSHEDESRQKYGGEAEVELWIPDYVPEASSSPDTNAKPKTRLDVVEQWARIIQMIYPPILWGLGIVIAGGIILFAVLFWGIDRQEFLKVIIGSFTECPTDEIFDDEEPQITNTDDYIAPHP